MSINSAPRVAQRHRAQRFVPYSVEKPSAPTVSVIVTCYNYGRFLLQSVGSALDQVGVTVDVIIVDDASSDDSLLIARELEAGDRRVQVLEHHFNRGAVQAFNHGLAVATGEFVVRLDADDLLTPGSLVRSTDLARAFPEVGLVYGHPLHFDSDDDHADQLPQPRTTPTAWSVWAGHDWLTDRCRTGVNVITSPEVLMRRSVVDVVGGQQNLAHAHDMEMWLRISAFSDVAYLHGADQAWHREHDASMTADLDPLLDDLKTRRDVFDTLFAGSAGSLPDSAELAALADTALANGALAKASQRLDSNTATDEEIEQFVAFARQMIVRLNSREVNFRTSHDDADRHPFATRIEDLEKWPALEARLRLAGQNTQTRPRFLMQRISRRLQSDRSWRRWHRDGVFE
ncbi:MAG: putative glycosyl transferase / polysaccharide biosynthesis domain protein [Subtercola sp.]|nr:putative glycosyl transferase / polysaccharide biosynthesis domain protein [Subtercola sp.]